MADVEQILYAALSAHPPLGLLVGDRIFPDEAPVDAALPLVVYGSGGTESLRDLQGNVYAQRTMIEVETYSETKATGKAIVSAIGDAMENMSFGDGTRHYVDDASSGATDVGHSFVVNITIWQTVQA